MILHQKEEGPALKTNSQRWRKGGPKTIWPPPRAARKANDFSLTLHCHSPTAEVKGNAAVEELSTWASQRTADVSSVLSVSSSAPIQLHEQPVVSPGEAWEDLHRAALGWTLVCPLEARVDGQQGLAGCSKSSWGAVDQQLNKEQKKLRVVPLPKAKKDQETPFFAELVNLNTVILRADRELLRCVDEMSAGSEGRDAMLTKCADGGIEWGDRDKCRFRNEEGGQGGTPLMQCVLLGQPASLLAARYMLYRYPGLVLDAYGEGPYLGQNLLHMCVVKQQREV